MIRIAIAAALLSSSSTFAHGKDGPGDHASTAAECRKMFKGKERAACRTCLKLERHHFHKAKDGERCHAEGDARNPIEKAGDAIGGAVDGAAKKAGEAGEKTDEGVRKAGDKAGEAAERARARARDAGD